MLLLPASLWCAMVVLATLARAQDDERPTTCYVLSGVAKIDAGYRCDNSTTGHSACCGIGAVCYSNGVCQQSNGPVQDYLRVGCTDRTWSDPACLQQCETFARGSTAGIRFCNGAITSTNQYCCDNGTKGIGSFACCDTPANIFRINPIATIVAQIPLTYTSSSIAVSSTSSAASSTSSDSSSTAATNAPASTSASSTPTPSPEPKKSNSTAIGVGVAVPVVVIIAALVAFFLWRRKKGRSHQAVELQTGEGREGDYRDGPGTPPEAGVELPGMSDGQKGYYAGRKYNPAPVELQSPNVVHELGDGR